MKGHRNLKNVIQDEMTGRRQSRYMPPMLGSGVRGVRFDIPRLDATLARLHAERERCRPHEIKEVEEQIQTLLEIRGTIQ